MSAQWKPGDVAMIEVGCHANVHRGMFIGGGWRYGDDKWVADDPAIVTARPLLVIDPEDREQVERLRALLEGMSYSAWACGALDCLRTALRSLAQPEDPEPTGLGAVVRDGEGVEWVRIQTIYSSPFLRRGANGTCLQKWSELARPITVLSTGWTEDER